MSLILDALKRSERERNGVDAPPSSPVQPEKPTRARRSPWIVGTAVFAVLAAAAWTAVFTLDAPKTPVQVAETKPVPVAPKPEPTTAEPAPVEPVVAEPTPAPPAPIRPPTAIVRPVPPTPVVIERATPKPVARLAGVTSPKPPRNVGPAIVAGSDIRQAEQHVIQAQALDRAGQAARAIEQYTRAILLKPGYHEAFFGRGWVHEGQRRHGPAIRDFSRAIDIAPNFAEAYFARAWALEQSGETADAIADYGRVIRLNRRHGEAYFSRGFLHLYGGQAETAARDFGAFEQVAEQPATKDYARLWRYIALARAGAEKNSVLDAAINSADANTLPATLIRLFRGDADAEQAIDAAADPDSKRRAANACIAYFFIGQRRLIEGRKSEAAELFRKALATGVTTLRQYAAAGKELARIEKARK